MKHDKIFAEFDEVKALTASTVAEIISRVIQPWRQQLIKWLKANGTLPPRGSLESQLKAELRPNVEAMADILARLYVRSANIAGEIATRRVIDAINATVRSQSSTVQEAASWSTPSSVYDQVKSSGQGPRLGPAAPHPDGKSTLQERLGLGQEWSTSLDKTGFHLRDPALLKKLQSRGTKICGDVSQTMLSDFRRVLEQQCYREGISPAQLAVDIDKIFPTTYAGRAVTIAKTEMYAAQSLVQHEAYLRDGVGKHMWRATMRNTRPTHAAANGQERPIDEPFLVGGVKMDCPHDEGAPAREVINCNCDELPIVSLDDLMPAKPWLGEPTGTVGGAKQTFDSLTSHSWSDLSTLTNDQLEAITPAQYLSLDAATQDKLRAWLREVKFGVAETATKAEKDAALKDFKAELWKKGWILKKPKTPTVPTVAPIVEPVVTAEKTGGGISSAVPAAEGTTLEFLTGAKASPISALIKKKGAAAITLEEIEAMGENAIKAITQQEFQGFDQTTRTALQEYAGAKWGWGWVGDRWIMHWDPKDLLTFAEMPRTVEELDRSLEIILYQSHRVTSPESAREILVNLATKASMIPHGDDVEAKFKRAAEILAAKMTRPEPLATGQKPPTWQSLKFNPRHFESLQARRNETMYWRETTQDVTSQTAKQQVMKSLASALEDDPDWQKLISNQSALSLGSRYGTTHSEQLASGLIAKWAESSADESATGIFMQLAARAEFGLDDSLVEHLTGRSTAYTRAQAMMERPELVNGARKFLRAMYNQTQQYYREKGVKTVTLYRGMGVDSSTLSRAVTGRETRRETLVTQPMSSFATRYDTARDFAEGMTTKYGDAKAVLAMEVPVERILGTCRTGYGCLDEHEVVVLGGTDEWGMTVTTRARGRLHDDVNDYWSALSKIPGD